MTDDTARANRISSLFIAPAIRWAGVSTAVAAAIVLMGVGVVALLGSRATPDTWSLWSSVGDTFGAITSVVSGLALVALVITFWAQYRELQSQRGELTHQRTSLDGLQTELYRGAEASLRRLHVQLLKMSIDDPDLAAVWPPLRPGLPHEVNRQYLYANLIYQQVWLSLRIGDYTEPQMLNHLRYLFTSPLMRDYWSAAEVARTSLIPGTQEHRFALMADEICREYEGVLASAGRGRQHMDARPEADWQELDNDTPTLSGHISAQGYPTSR